MDDHQNKLQKTRTRRGKKKLSAAEASDNVSMEGDASSPRPSKPQSVYKKKSVAEMIMARTDLNAAQTNLVSDVVQPKRGSYSRLQSSIGQGDGPHGQHGEHWSQQPNEEDYAKGRCDVQNTNYAYSDHGYVPNYYNGPAEGYDDSLRYFSPHGNNSHRPSSHSPNMCGPQYRHNTELNSPHPRQQYEANITVKTGRNHSWSNGSKQHSPSQGQHSGHGRPRNHQHAKKQYQSIRFETYWLKEDISTGLKRDQIIEGPIRINPKNYEDAYVPLPDGSGDIYISGFNNRNRALNGDVVAVLLLERENWRVYENDLETYETDLMKSQLPTETAEGGANSTASGEDSGPDVVIESEEIVDKIADITNNTLKLSVNVYSKSVKGDQAETKNNVKTPNVKRDKKKYTSVKDVLTTGSPVAKDLFKSQTPKANVKVDKFLQKVGKVVAILERKHSRAASGHIKLLQDKSKETALFSPFDHRLPRIHIPMSECPKDFYERPDDHATTIFIARIIEWEETSQYAKGKLGKSLGEAGLIEPETDALLMENDVDFSEFSDEAIDCLPKHLPWKIPQKEYQKRRDFRKECVFTIDPSTARDLDDAVSCRRLEDDMYEIGVHIADVSYFIEPQSALDKVAAGRATSVYLTQKVIPMLPRLLCEQLCSLNPDEDRLSFSVCWKMNSKGEIFEEWFGRSVIRSCVKLSYSHAQGFIDDPEKLWTEEELPPISEGFTVNDIKSRTLVLHKVARNLRQARFDQGALRLDQVKLQFSLDKDTGLPNGYTVYQQRESNKLIEEFMLLANMAVAHKINSCFPEKAALRCHPPPQSKMIDDLKKTCQELGISMDVSSSQSIHRSILQYVGNDEFTVARMQVLVALCSKPMQNAKYFCAGMYNDENDYRHYALNVPLYTHFTSPIRRYPDIMVHRLLGAALGYCDPPSEDKKDLHKQADHCNDKKTNAKRCSEISNEIFFSVFVKEAGPFDERGMVMAVLDRSFDVFILKLGVVKRVYCDKLEIKDKIFDKGSKVPKLTLLWPVTDEYPKVTRQEISIFSLVNCILKADMEPLKWTAYIKRPSE